MTLRLSTYNNAALAGVFLCLNLHLSLSNSGSVNYSRGMICPIKASDQNNLQLGTSPLSAAGRSGHLEIAKVLLEHGASPNAHQQVNI